MLSICREKYSAHPSTKAAILFTRRLSTSLCVSPAALSCRFATSSEWSPPSTTSKLLGARIPERTAAKQVQRAQGIPGALHEENRRGHFAQHPVAQLRAISRTAERITKAHDRVHFFHQREVTTHPRPHAFADEHDRTAMSGAQPLQRGAMGRHQPGASGPAFRDARACRDNPAAPPAQVLAGARPNAASRDASKVRQHRGAKRKAGIAPYTPR